MRIGRNVQDRSTHRPDGSNGVLEKQGADAGSHVLWVHPQVFELESFPLARQGVEPDDLGVPHCAEHRAVDDELRRYREVSLPQRDELLGVAPVAFGRVGDCGEALGIGWASRPNVHLRMVIYLRLPNGALQVTSNFSGSGSARSEPLGGGLWLDHAISLKVVPTNCVCSSMTLLELSRAWQSIIVAIDKEDECGKNLLLSVFDDVL